MSNDQAILGGTEVGDAVKSVRRCTRELPQAAIAHSGYEQEQAMVKSQALVLMCVEQG